MIVGSSGFLGSSLAKLLGDEKIQVEAVDRTQLDLSQSVKISFEKLQNKKEFNYVVICAAITDVNRCFEEQSSSHQVNVLGTEELLLAVREHGAIPVFFSSDYVFGTAGSLYREDAERRPETVYGKQKLRVEKFLESNFARFLLFRTSKLMSKSPSPRNILFPLLRHLSLGEPVSCFSDQWITPVFVEDIAEILKRAFLSRENGFFHLGTERVFSRFELACELAAGLGFDPQLIQAIRMSDMKFSERRPSHNTLDCRKASRVFDFKFCEVSEAMVQLRGMIASVTALGIHEAPHR